MILKILVVFLCATSTRSLYLKQAPTVCNTPSCFIATDYIRSGLDESVNPCDDFYAFTCNNYKKQIAEGSVYNEFYGILNDQSDKLITLLHELTVKKSPFKSKSAELIYRLYDSCKKSNFRPHLALDKAKEILKEFGGWIAANEGDLPKVDWTEIAFKLSANGLNANIFLPLLIMPNIYDKEKHALTITGPPTVLAYTHILKQDFDEPELKSYINIIVQWATVMGATNASYAEEEAKKIIELERKLSQIKKEKKFEQMSVSELQTKYPGIGWKTYLSKVTNIDIQDDDAVMYPRGEFLSKISDIFRTTPQRTLASYVQYRAIAELLSAVGFPTMTSTERNCFELIKNRLSIAVSALYVRKYISKETKQQATELVGKVKSSFSSLIQGNEWADEATKNAAMKKIEHLYDLVAYPDELLDDKIVDKYYETVEYKENFLEFLASISKSTNNAMYSKFRTVPKRDDWESLPLIDVNALYNPFGNAILILAGIIASPFYNPNFPNYMNYASMGSTIGHEINHGLSGTGFEYDEYGLKRFWASDHGLAKLNETSHCLRSQYFQQHNDEAMAERTNNEDQADATGVIAGYFAYQKWIELHSDEGRLPYLDKYTPNQLFWISYGRYWCAVESKEYLNNFLVLNIHSRNMYRVRIPLMNSEEFSKDFQCPSGSKMNPVKKCKIWN